MVARIVEARRAGRPVVMGIGGHVIKVGLSPLLVDLMERGVLTALAMNGSGIIHDFELALVGHTSEEVEEVLGEGAFGMAEETGRILHEAIAAGARDGLGLGEAVGRRLAAMDLPHAEMSLLLAGHRLGVPVTVHVALGADIIHMHPAVDGAAVGAASHRDFLRFAGVIAALEGGVYLNVGSAVIMPEVFVKALSLVRNLGHEVRRFTTVNLDFIQHYRPRVNVVQRPTQQGGEGYALTGHHEIMLPLLCAAVLEALP
ncbi:MAG: hypothetical protein HYV08_03080 [Deltaproteobacteria bacterium]|nr:hypothetical protein [Deltaproteobacteria bacterium]